MARMWSLKIPPPPSKPAALHQRQPRQWPNSRARPGPDCDQRFQVTTRPARLQGSPQAPAEGESQGTGLCRGARESSGGTLRLGSSVTSAGTATAFRQPGSLSAPSLPGFWLGNRLGVRDSVSSLSREPQMLLPPPGDHGNRRKCGEQGMVMLFWLAGAGRWEQAGGPGRSRSGAGGREAGPEPQTHKGREEEENCNNIRGPLL